MSDELLPPATFEEAAPAVETEAEAAPSPAVEATQPAEPAQVPLSALQQERAEKKALRDRIPLLEQKIEALMQMVAQKDAPRPAPLDPIADPERFTAAMQAQIAAVHANTQAEISERLTRQKHGDDVVDEAFAAAQAAGAINQFRGRKDPWGDLVKWHKEQQLAREIGGDPEAYKARLREQLLAEIRASGGQSAPAAPSLAAQPNLGTRAAPAWSGPAPLDEILGGGSTF